MVRVPDVRNPEAAEAAPFGDIPGGIRSGQLATGLTVIRNEGLVLDDERHNVAPVSGIDGTGDGIGNDGAGNAEILEGDFLRRVHDKVRSRFAALNTQAGGGIGVIVIPEHTSALLVGEIQRHHTVGERRAGIHALCAHALRGHHVRNVNGADALRETEARGLTVATGRGGPLVRRTVTDPGRVTAMEVDIGTLERCHLAGRAVVDDTGTSKCGVNRESKVRGERVLEEHADRTIPGCNDHRAKILVLTRSGGGGIVAGIQLNIATKAGGVRTGRQIGVQLLSVF